MSTKKWRRLEVGEIVADGDRYNNKINRGQSINPPALGYIPANESIGRTVTSSDSGWYIREVEEPVAQEPVTGKLTPEQAFEHVKALWPDTSSIAFDAYGLTRKSNTFEGGVSVGAQVEWPEGVTEWPPQPKWETPVLPFDWGKECDFSNDGIVWFVHTLIAFHKDSPQNGLNASWCGNNQYYIHCRIDRNRYPLPEAGK